MKKLFVVLLSNHEEATIKIELIIVPHGVVLYSLEKKDMFWWRGTCAVLTLCVMLMFYSQFIKNAWSVYIDQCLVLHTQHYWIL